MDETIKFLKDLQEKLEEPDNNMPILKGSKLYWRIVDFAHIETTSNESDTMMLTAPFHKYDIVLDEGDIPKESIEMIRENFSEETLDALMETLTANKDEESYLRRLQNLLKWYQRYINYDGVLIPVINVEIVNTNIFLTRDEAVNYLKNSRDWHSTQARIECVDSRSQLFGKLLDIVKHTDWDKFNVE